MDVKSFLRHVLRYIGYSRIFLSLLPWFHFFLCDAGEKHEKRVKSSQAKLSCRIMCTLFDKRRVHTHTQEPSHAKKMSKHWRINISMSGILVMPHFYVHYITQFDQSSRLTAYFRLTATDLHDIRLEVHRKKFAVSSFICEFIRLNIQLSIDSRISLKIPTFSFS